MSTEFSPDQHAAVKRIMKLKAHEYYEILLVDKKCSSGDVKKAYRKQALMLHPDKNKAPDADEAFKRVSHAFQVLSDENKRRIFDQTGADPDARSTGMGGGGFPGGANSPFGRQTRFSFAQPDDLFSQMFGGPMGGGPQFQTFHFGGGGDPNDLFSQLFGEAIFGNRPRARPQARRPANSPEQEAQARRSNLINFAIIGVVLVLPTLLGWIFDSASSTSSLPKFRFTQRSPYTEPRHTPKYGVPFYVNPKDISELNDKKLKTLDTHAENQYISSTSSACRQEYLTRQQHMQDAIGIFFTDHERYEEAKAMPLPHCDVLDELGIKLRGLS